MNSLKNETPKGGGENMSPTLQRVIRLDSQPITLAQFTPEGYLSDRPILTSTGIFEYRNADGSVRRELRLPEDVFDPESLASYKGKPIIITHDAGLIDKNNVRDEGIGTILTEGYRDHDDVRAEIVIHDTDAMKDCRFKELSLGYNLELEETPGEYKGEHYDAIQRNIRINHLALVREARAGEQARLNIDGRDSDNILKGGKIMKKTPAKTKRLDGVLSPEELEQAIAEYKAKHAPAKEADLPAKDSDEPAKATEVPAAAEEKPVVDAPKPEDAAPAEPKVAGDAEGGETPAEEVSLEEKFNEIKDKDTHTDEDVQKLCDIIDSLLAERDFNRKDEGDAPEGEEKKPEVGADGNDADIPAVTDTEVDGCGNKDGEEEETANCDDENSDIPDATAASVAPATDMNTDSAEDIIAQRIEIGMLGRTLNLDGLEKLSIKEGKKAIIAAVRPNIRLDGKSESYVNVMFDMSVDEIKSNPPKGIEYQKQQMFNLDSRTDATGSRSSMDARAEMIARQQNKNKEEM